VYTTIPLRPVLVIGAGLAGAVSPPHHPPQAINAVTAATDNVERVIFVESFVNFLRS
jgi:hypothetical protein